MAGWLDDVFLGCDDCKTDRLEMLVSAAATASSSSSSSSSISISSSSSSSSSNQDETGPAELWRLRQPPLVSDPLCVL
jgi:hypothetical protein